MSELLQKNRKDGAGISGGKELITSLMPLTRLHKRRSVLLGVRGLWNSSSPYSGRVVDITVSELIEGSFSPVGLGWARTLYLKKTESLLRQEPITRIP